MLDVIRWMKNRLQRRSKISTAAGEITGFVYVGQGEDTPMSAAAPGVRIGNSADTPPWIVVFRSFESVHLARWPGRLWKVRVVERASEQPRSYAHYTRAVVVDVLEELHPSTLFRFNGEAVIEFLNNVSRLDLSMVERLSEVEDQEAAPIHQSIWERWIIQVHPDSSVPEEDYADTLRIGTRAPCSPVGMAPSVLFSELTRRARALVGQGAFVEEDDAVVFNPAWARAATALQHALFSLGTEEHLVSASERAVLRRGYDKAVPAVALTHA